MPTIKPFLRYGTWILLALIILFIVLVRVRLREMPLERDEGEYAYAGQLMLQGIAPYKLAYNMKFPGVYAAYAAIMFLFGQTASGIHLGLLTLNAASVVMVFLLGRKLLDELSGLVAALSFALLSLSPSVLGLQAHASHFGVFFALAGALLLLRSPPSAAKELANLFGCGFLFGLAFLMKQPGVFWGLFALIYLIWRDAHSEKVWTWSKKNLGRWVCYTGGFLSPLLLACSALLVTGAFSKFVFWCFTYAREYVSSNSIFSIHSSLLHELIDPVLGPNLLFWILGAIGMIVMWWDERLLGHRFFIAGFVLASLAAVIPGWYFRQHYFVFALPAVALMAGVVASRSFRLIQRDKSVELFLSIVLLAILGVAVVYALVEHGSFWFELSPVEACRQSYRWQMFPEEADLGIDLRRNSSPQARIAVLGSEPQIYFYARRHSATGYIYTFALMEKHKYALQMQDEMIAEIEAAKPEYLIFIKLEESWALRTESERKILNWYERYSDANYNLVRTIQASDQGPFNDPHAPGRTAGLLLVYERKDLRRGN
jgi:4-amino-4-deoxy-L-arabinose transferase-like glycosyltransferase